MMVTQLALPLDSSLEAILNEWALYGTAAGHSERTITARADTVRRVARSTDPLSVTTTDLVEWLASLDVDRSSLATYRSHLRAFYAWVTATGRRLDNPAAATPSPRAPRTEPRPLTEDQVAALYAATSHPRAASTRAYVVLACYAGLRVHEIAKVRASDFTGTRLSVVGKGGRRASIPAHDEVIALAQDMPRFGWWFPSPSGTGHVHRVSVGLAIARAMKRAGIDATPHACRHFYGTEVLRTAGGNLRVAQRAMRHADIRSTAIYTLVADDELEAAVCAIPTGRPRLYLVK